MPNKLRKTTYSVLEEKASSLMPISQLARKQQRERKRILHL